MGRNCARNLAQQSGDAANDWLVGAAGHDRPHGRGGDDWLVVANDGDHLDLSAGAAGFITLADASRLRFKGAARTETVQSEPVRPNQAPGIVELSANAVYENAADATVAGVVSGWTPIRARPLIA